MQYFIQILHVSLTFKQPFSSSKSLWEKLNLAIKPIKEIGKKYVVSRLHRLRPQEDYGPETFTPRSEQI